MGEYDSRADPRILLTFRARVGALREIPEKKTQVPLSIYIISAKRIHRELPHQSCGTLKILEAVDSAELNMLTANLLFGFGHKSFQTVP